MICLTSSRTLASRPRSRSLLSRVLLRPAWNVALTAARPTTAPRPEDKNRADTAGERCALSTEAWTEVKVALIAIPVPKPPGKIYRDSTQFVWPCHRSNSSEYALADIKVAR